MYTIVQQFGARETASKLYASGLRAVRMRPVMEEIGVDMVRVTGILWRAQGRRGGGSWKKLTEPVVARKGSRKILYTAGSNPGYTPHGDEDVLAASVTEPGAKHQILRFTRETVEFGTNVPYARKQFEKRPFIRFLPSDQARWNLFVQRHLHAPFKVK